MFVRKNDFHPLTDKNMKVKKIHENPQNVQEIPALLDKANVAFQPINVVNWPSYPYKPEAAFRMGHTGDAILLHYRVMEDSVRARYGEDNGNVWTDSCVEFFSIPAGDGIYYNLECSCIGTVLLAAGPERNNREYAPQEVTSRVRRWSSLGRQPFEERVGECSWELALWVPCSVFFKHDVRTLDGVTVKANFYKCGDELQKPHFLSWNPILIEKPDFHRPDFFGTLEIE